MTDDSNAAIHDTQTDEDILSYTVSDEALEAAAGTERGANTYFVRCTYFQLTQC